MGKNILITKIKRNWKDRETSKRQIFEFPRSLSEGQQMDNVRRLHVVSVDLEIWN